MTLPQILSVTVLIGMMGLFLWGRFRYDVVAVMALLAAVATGLVKPENAFSGFSDDIVIIVGSALVLSGAVQRSGVIERLMRQLQTRVTRVRSQPNRRVDCKAGWQSPTQSTFADPRLIR